MNLTLNRPSVNAWWSAFVISEIQRQRRHLYVWVKQKLKCLMRLALVKLMFRLNHAVERALKILMRWLHLIEKTKIFKTVSLFIVFLIQAVKQDGLKFTILLTTLGYTAWCLAIF